MWTSEATPVVEDRKGLPDVISSAEVPWSEIERTILLPYIEQFHAAMRQLDAVAERLAPKGMFADADRQVWVRKSEE